MLKVHRLPNPERVEEEAGDWIARLNADRVSAEDRAQFEMWRNAHPLHARTYDAMSAAWRAFNAAGPVVRAVSFGQSMNDAAQAPKKSPQRWVFGGVASAVVVIIALFLYWVQRLPETRFETAIGEHASVALPDGSSVELNSNSAVRVDYSAHARVIQLQHGEAFFNVAHDTSRPFWVVADGSWVRAVGTSFNVYVRAQGVRVTVSEGTVQVGRAESPDSAPNAQELARESASVLSAGQQADVHGGTASIRTLPPTEIRRSTAWRSGKVYFEKQPLGAVIEELGRYTTLQLIVSEDKLRQLPVGGIFQANPDGAETLISMLKDGFRLQIRREPGRVYIEDEAAALPE